MNNRELNREFEQKLKNKSYKKTGFTDSEDDDDIDKSLRSPKSGRSTMSNRSSLLSGRSPRDETSKRNPMLSTMRPTNNNHFGRRLSSEQKRYSDSDEDTKSPRRDRYGKEKSLSPKSHSRSSERSDNSPLNSGRQHQQYQQQKFIRGNSLSKENENSRSNQLSPKNPHSPRRFGLAESNRERDERDLLGTMRRPLNDNFTKTMSRDERYDGEFQAQKTRVATPTKLSMTQQSKMQHQGLHLGKASSIDKRNTLNRRLEDDLEEEEFTNSGRTTPSRHSSRNKLFDSSLSPRTSPSRHDDLTNHSFKKQGSRSPPDVSPRQLKANMSNKKEIFNESSMSQARTNKQNAKNQSPRDSLNVYEKDSDDDEFSKKLYEKQTNTFNNLMNPKTANNIDSRRKSQIEDEKEEENLLNVSKQHLKKQQSDLNSHNGFFEKEKDPEVNESLEDSRIAEKLQKERERKRILRENRAKNQTESTKIIENAIEQVENAMEDSIRYEKLKEKSDQLKYSTKPPLNETKLFETKILSNERASRNTSANNRSMTRANRTRSLSSSGGERFLNTKYANVKPKTQTRPQAESARTNAEDEFSNSKLMNNSMRSDLMNDSSSIRQSIYNEWYQRKMSEAKIQLKESQLKQRDEEERKAQEMIEKLQKSRLVFKIWNEKKEETLKDKRKSLKLVDKKEKDKEEEKREKKKEAEMAFKEWLRVKTEMLREQKQEKLEKERKERKEKKLKELDTTDNKKKPPVPYDLWVKKKEREIEHKMQEIEEKKYEKMKLAEEKRRKRQLAEKSFQEWLDKKEDEELNKSRSNLNRSLSNSMSMLPPFYPTSRTIPFGR